MRGTAEGERGSGKRNPMENPDLVELGRRIRMRREQLGMSQEELGLEIRTDKGKISRYESGQMVMRVDRFFQIAEALQAPLEELCPSWLCDGERMDPRLRRLGELLGTLSAEKQAEACRGMEALAMGFQALEQRRG